MKSELKLTNGVDIVDIRRIEKILNGKRDIFLDKIFTEKEKEYLSGKKYRANSVAGLFASKEAISKAIGTGIGKISWKDIEIRHDKDGKPYIVFSSKVLERYEILDMSVSISHEKNYAIAFVVGKIGKRQNDEIWKG